MDWHCIVQIEKKTTSFFLSKPNQSKSKIWDKETLPEVFTSIFKYFFSKNYLFTFYISESKLPFYTVNSKCWNVGPYVGPSNINKAVLPVELQSFYIDNKIRDISFKVTRNCKNKCVWSHIPWSYEWHVPAFSPILLCDSP